MVVTFAHKYCICLTETTSTQPAINATEQTSQSSTDLFDMTTEPDAYTHMMTSQHVTDERYTTSAPPSTDVTSASLRLPRSLKPEHYNVEIAPWFYSNDTYDFAFESVSEMFLLCEEDTDVISFHAFGFWIFGNISVIDTSDESALDIANETYYDFEREFHVIALKTPLVAGQRVKVTVPYSNSIFGDRRGLYWSDYQDANDTTR